MAQLKWELHSPLYLRTKLVSLNPTGDYAIQADIRPIKNANGNCVKLWIDIFYYNQEDDGYINILQANWDKDCHTIKSAKKQANQFFHKLTEKIIEPQTLFKI